MYAIIFIRDDLEERILEDIEMRPHIWWRYINDICFIWEHGKDSLKLVFVKHLMPVTPLSNLMRNSQKKK